MDVNAEFRRNPLNIRFSPSNDWLGQSTSYRGFCLFESESYCFRAGAVLLYSYRHKGVTSIRGIIERYAPEEDGNATRDYVNSVCVAMGMCPTDEVQPIDYPRLLSVMAWIESGRRIEPNAVLSLINSVDCTLYNRIIFNSIP